ncbi:helix-turn-helix transcriptional regulator [Streptomyces sp. DG2A-72]|uniref:helix-turn-helix domain-containing protein n=1 Tax=Streptomyces sp. DG2A-72 TaxID=3051386 RepID=UPI00265BB633|nr:helix-turn-helix transcriptional regulator [Streptomyces sp. DG2A-72]MDO0931551.1 helix-turn-helix transcriptional regulator [Streptomyces sp. DG2A-72]
MNASCSGGAPSTPPSPCPFSLLTPAFFQTPLTVPSAVAESAYSTRFTASASLREEETGNARFALFGPAHVPQSEARHSPAAGRGVTEVEVLEQSHDFGRELRRRRLAARLSLQQLGQRVHYSKSQLSKVERGIKRPTSDLARLCDTELRPAARRFEFVPAGHTSRADRRRGRVRADNANGRTARLPHSRGDRDPPGCFTNTVRPVPASGPGVRSRERAASPHRPDPQPGAARPAHRPPYPPGTPAPRLTLCRVRGLDGAGVR